MNSDTSMPSPESVHISVLLNEAVDALAPKAGGRYLDGTVGMGGHSFAIMERTGGEGFLCGLDRDRQALELARIRLAPFGDRVHLVHTRYSEFEAALDGIGWDAVDGALIDIGVSSLQIDSAERGFSFSSDGPLDMRMDRDSEELPVSRLVNRAKLEDLKDIIERYGEDPQAGRIARAIVEARVRKPIETTGELAALVERAYPAAWRAKARNHPATRTFQALRMAVQRRDRRTGTVPRRHPRPVEAGRARRGHFLPFLGGSGGETPHEGMGAGLHLPQAHPRVRVPSCAGSPACDPEARLSFRTGAHAQPPRGQRKLRVAEKLDPHARKADEDSRRRGRAPAVRSQARRAPGPARA